MATDFAARQEWTRRQVEALIDLGDDPREAEEYVRATLEMLSPWADPETEVPDPTAVARAAALDDRATFDARVEWYAADWVPPKYKRLLDARLSAGG